MDTLTAADLDARLRAAFGPRWRAWAFACPVCGTVATGADMLTAIDPLGVRPDAHRAAFDALGQECLERVRWRVGACPDRACDARAVTHGTVLVAHPDGTTSATFPLARPQTRSPNAVPDAPQTRPADTPGDAPDAPRAASADAPGPAPARNRYAHDDGAQNNRLAKAEALADAMHQLGVHPDDVFAADRAARLAARLRVRKAAFGPHPKSASDDTWRVAVGVLRRRGLAPLRTPG